MGTPRYPSYAPVVLNNNCHSIRFNSMKLARGAVIEIALN